MHTNSWWWGQWPWGHQYPWGVGGPWDCCSRVRVQSTSGLTATWQSGTYLQQCQNRYTEHTIVEAASIQPGIAHSI